MPAFAPAPEIADGVAVRSVLLLSAGRGVADVLQRGS
jgi:hypothetical protein